VPSSADAASFALAQTLAGVAAWDWDIVAGVTHCSPNYFTLYGLPMRDYAPERERWLALIHPDDRDRVRAGLGAAVELGTEFDTEFQVLLGRWKPSLARWARESAVL
jgi:hypothetical protein